MGELFSKIVDMTVMGSVVILITVIARFILRNRSKRFIMILWAVVAIRLLIPINIESSLSIFNYLPFSADSMSTIAQVREPDMPERSSDLQIVPAQDAVGLGDLTVRSSGDNVVNIVEQASADRSPDIMTVLSIVWFAGTAAMIGYCSIRYILLRRDLKDAGNIGDNIYVSDKIAAPFVFGFFAPGIYLPDNLDNGEKEHVLQHERTHIRHGDHIRKILGMFVVSVHWFNPLVWIAYSLFEQDIEMSCDECVVAGMDPDMKRAYMMSIVSYAKMSNSKRYLVTPLGFSMINFSKREVTHRVKNMINYKNGKAFTAAAIIAVMLLVGLGCSLNSTTSADEESSINETAGSSEPDSTEDTSATEETSTALISAPSEPAETLETEAPDDFAGFVKSFVNCPYVYAGASESGFDDSGLVSYCYQVYYGISLPHGSDQICNESGINVSRDDLQAGDIICYDYGNRCGHVAIYIGDGQIIHASNTKGYVSFDDIDIMEIRAIKRIV